MLSNEAISLRPILKEDLTVLNQWKNDEETYMFLGGGYRPTSVDEQAKWMDDMISHEGANRRFMICQKEDDKPVGIIGLYGINWIHRTTELGIFIGDKNVFGKGYGYLSCILLEEYAKDYLNLRKLKIHVVTDNDYAFKLYRRLGFSLIGEYEKDRFIKGSYRNVTLMEKFLE